MSLRPAATAVLMQVQRLRRADMRKIEVGWT